MSKRALKKSKRRSKAVIPALGITGLSLSVAGGATASIGEAMDVPSTSQPHELFLGEEEVFDTSLSAFYTFDKENGEQTSLAQHLKLAAHGGGCGCGHGGGCGGGGRLRCGCPGLRRSWRLRCRCPWLGLWRCPCTLRWKCRCTLQMRIF